MYTIPEDSVNQPNNCIQMNKCPIFKTDGNGSPSVLQNINTNIEYKYTDNYCGLDGSTPLPCPSLTTETELQGRGNICYTSGDKCVSSVNTDAHNIIREIDIYKLQDDPQQTDNDIMVDIVCKPGYEYVPTKLRGDYGIIPYSSIVCDSDNKYNIKQNTPECTQIQCKLPCNYINETDCNNDSQCAWNNTTNASPSCDIIGYNIVGQNIDSQSITCADGWIHNPIINNCNTKYVKIENILIGINTIITFNNFGHDITGTDLKVNYIRGNKKYSASAIIFDNTSYVNTQLRLYNFIDLTNNVSVLPTTDNTPEINQNVYIYNDEIFLKNCECPPGNYINITDNNDFGKCLQCPHGTYNMEKNKTQCNFPDNGYYVDSNLTPPRQFIMEPRYGDICNEIIVENTDDPSVCNDYIGCTQNPDPSNPNKPCIDRCVELFASTSCTCLVMPSVCVCVRVCVC